MPPNPRRPLSPSLPELIFAPPAARLYAIVDADVCAHHRRAPLDVARAFLSAGAKLIQLRCKSWGSADFLDLAHRIVEEGLRAQAAVIINDRADVAALSHAHGLHIGQEDLLPADARAVIGAEPILGLSTHAPEQWTAAIDEPISYIAIGPVYGTGTKDTGYHAVGLDTVSRASSAAARAGLPTVAIGGITIDNALPVIEAGARSVAIISDLMQGEPEARCRALLRMLE
ncbi:MAG TPA: thiamine phosphate synthase [Vicinamibacterales bacterium]|nr:thiamine phosphate synthase [Vicinamibacterales bacterium]